MRWFWVCLRARSILTLRRERLSAVYLVFFRRDCPEWTLSACRKAADQMATVAMTLDRARAEEARIRRACKRLGIDDPRVDEMLAEMRIEAIIGWLR